MTTCTQNRIDSPVAQKMLSAPVAGQPHTRFAALSESHSPGYDAHNRIDSHKPKLRFVSFLFRQIFHRLILPGHPQSPENCPNPSVDFKFPKWVNSSKRFVVVSLFLFDAFFSNIQILFLFLYFLLLSSPDRRWTTQAGGDDATAR